MSQNILDRSGRERRSACAVNPSRREVLAGAGLLAMVVGGCARETASSSKMRDIGFDLWVGRPGVDFGDGVAISSGSRSIRGPYEWRHPITGETMLVYERLNREARGEKRQLFALNHDGAALGRVFDSRPGRSDRWFIDDAFFPLGAWTPGERRRFEMVEHEGGSAQRATAELRVRRLSFDYRDVEESLKYDWVLTDASGRKVYDERYIYSPGEGFVRFSNRMSKG